MAHLHVHGSLMFSDSLFYLNMYMYIQYVFYFNSFFAFIFIFIYLYVLGHVLHIYCVKQSFKAGLCTFLSA